MAAMLPNASNLNIGYAIQNNHFAPGPKSQSNPLKELCDRVAGVALHGSSARADAPKCHEDTREAVQSDIFSWAERQLRPPDRPSAGEASQEIDDILWLTGPAGTGKTAIMGTVSDTLEKAGKLAANFYFSSAMGVAGTTSKALFVTTLAYQMATHRGLKGRLASLILQAVQENPAIFLMSLERQLEVLILEPLRLSRNHLDTASAQPTCILVDGVDECGGSGDEDARRSRERDQTEVLAVLRQAAKDPAFPFRIIVASRPETWIRRYLTEKAGGKVHEIFLDEKYGPDDDIRLYLTSKFSEIARQSGVNPSTWPSEGAVSKLVENASGQFIYAATVVRWVETPGAYPQAQLDAVLNLKVSPGAASHPLAVLDALYTSILKSTPNPDTTVLWLKGLHHVQQAYGNGLSYAPSAWTLDRLFGSHEGQAESVLGGLPSLIYKLDRKRTDLTCWKEHHGDSMLIGLSALECNTSYAFYHKSFLDYLDGDSRCGGEFSTLTGAKAISWLAARISQTLRSPGAEVFISQPLLHTFQRCFMDLVVSLSRRGSICLDATVVGDDIPDQWIRVLEITPTFGWIPPCVLRALYVIVHTNCRQGLPCNQCCKRWRGAISKLPREQWRNPEHLIRWTREDLRLDRFCIKRLPLETITRGV